MTTAASPRALEFAYFRLDVSGPCGFAGLIDERALTGTLTETLGPIDAATLRAAHARLESGRMIGKLAVAGWPGAPR